MREQPCCTLSKIDPDDLAALLLRLLESGPGTGAGTVLELFVRQTNLMRIALDNRARQAASSSESGLAVRRVVDQGKAAGFASVNQPGPEGYLAALIRADQELTPLDPDLAPADLPDLAEAQAPPPETGATPTPEELTAWLEAAVNEVEERAGDNLPVQVVQAWVEAGVTGEAVVNSNGVRTGRSWTRIWAGMQVRSGSGGTCHESFRLMVPCEGERFPQVAPVLERLQSAADADRVMELRPSSLLILLPEAAATLIHAVAAVVHGESASVGGPGGEAWSLTDEPVLPGMLFGGAFDGVGHPTRSVVLAGEGRIRARLSGRGHAWRRSYKEPPLKGFSNLVFSSSGGARPDGIVVTSLTIHRLAANRYFAEGEAVGGKIRFSFNPARIPALLRGTCGLPRLTASGVLTPELILAV